MNQERREELVIGRALESAMKYFCRYLDAKRDYTNPNRRKAMTHYHQMSEDALLSVRHLKDRFSQHARERLQDLGVLAIVTTLPVYNKETQAA